MLAGGGAFCCGASEASWGDGERGWDTNDDEDLITDEDSDVDGDGRNVSENKDRSYWSFQSRPQIELSLSSTGRESGPRRF